MEIKDPNIETLVKIYEDKCCSSHFYEGTPEGNLHQIESKVMRACLKQLEILDEAQISKIVKRATLRAEKSKTRARQ